MTITPVCRPGRCLAGHRFRHEGITAESIPIRNDARKRARRPVLGGAVPRTAGACHTAADREPVLEGRATVLL
jgi:hypothetical protein